MREREKWKIRKKYKSIRRKQNIENSNRRRFKHKDSGRRGRNGEEEGIRRKSKAKGKNYLLLRKITDSGILIHFNTHRWDLGKRKGQWVLYMWQPTRKKKR